jgi:nucleoside-diphosphate-sugar epimerase
MNVLVTGGSGFIGSHLVGRLLSEGIGVLVPHREEEVPWRLGEYVLHEGLTRFPGADLADSGGIREIIGDLKPDAVVHAAAYGVQQQKFTDPIEAVRTNVEGTTVLAEGCCQARTGLMVLIGTAVEYQKQMGPISEQGAIKPETFYGVTKAAGWMMADYYRRTQGLPLITLRVFPSYGAKETITKLIPYILDCALNGRPLQLRCPDHQLDYIYVADVVEAVVWALKGKLERGQDYNVCTGKGHPVRHIAEQIYRMVDVVFPSTRLEPLAVKPTETLIGDPGKLKGLGWAPGHSLKSGLQETVRWYVEHRAEVEALS